MLNPEKMIAKLMHGFVPASLREDGRSVELDNPKGASVNVMDLNKSFSAQHVLRKVNLSIKPGETFFIIGPSGTGKSVLLKHIARLERADSGMIAINGQNIMCEGPLCEEKNYRYSMVFQTSALLNSLTVDENVGLWLREKRVCPESRVREIIGEKLSLVGLEDVREKRIHELSGGMKKRVAIARALAMNPDLVLYDEPTAELDPVTTDGLADVIQKVKQARNTTNIIVSHDLNFAMYLADRIAMMHEGQIIQIGTPSEIQNSDNEIIKKFIYTTTKGLTQGDVNEN